MFDREKFPIVAQASLAKIAESHSLRCDSKQFEKRFQDLDDLLSNRECVFLGSFLPSPLVKGASLNYLQEGEGVPVVNTLSIQNMNININDCRYISEDDFSRLSASRVLKRGDVLLTMDGGTSIGKPVLFDFDDDYTVDSHVAILRPRGISAKALVYLLASPLGQLQFQRYESGASGQTAVTEEDLRRFVFPVSSIDNLEEEVEVLDIKRKQIMKKMEELRTQESQVWENFTIKLR